MLASIPLYRDLISSCLPGPTAIDPALRAESVVVDLQNDPNN